MSTQPSDAASRPAIAVIGCGAISESFLVPSLVRIPRMAEHLVLVDSNQKRASSLAEQFGIPTTATDYHDVLGKVRGAVVAVPHHLHVAVSSDFLRAGVHVLCEKPLAESSREVRELMKLADQHRTTISVNNSRRTYPSAFKVNELIRSGVIGAVKSITYLDGAEFDWPSATGFYFDSRISSKGVLLDMGAHVLDLFCWWLGTKPRLESSENDSFGGPEAVTSVRLSWDGGEGTMVLSRLAKLANNYSVKGEKGTITGEVYDFNTITLTQQGKSSVIQCKPREGRDPDLGVLLMDNFLAVIDGREAPIIPASEALPSIELIEEAYQRAVRFPMPWYAREGAAQ